MAFVIGIIFAALALLAFALIALYRGCDLAKNDYDNHP